MMSETNAELLVRARRYRNLAGMIDDPEAVRSCLEIAEACEDRANQAILAAGSVPEVMIDYNPLAQPDQ
jgi:hypothetical protein